MTARYLPLTAAEVIAKGAIVGPGIDALDRPNARALVMQMT
jgi:hypothetical protein